MEINTSDVWKVAKNTFEKYYYLDVWADISKHCCSFVSVWFVLCICGLFCVCCVWEL